MLSPSTLRGAALTLALLAPACRVAQSAAELPGQTVRAMTPGREEKKIVDPVEVQQKLLRFTDEYSTRLASGVDELRSAADSNDSIEALQWKLALTTELCSIASGSNPVANLVDMAVFVSVARLVLEQRLREDSANSAVNVLLEHSGRAEQEVWKIAELVLTAQQKDELNQAIAVWREQNPRPTDVLVARAPGLALRVGDVSKADAARPESVFALLRVDPLAGMDPAVREIAQTRLFAERALFVMQQMPTLLRWQTELLARETAALPQVDQLLASSTAIAASVERVSAVAEKLPGQISAEREALLAALEAQEQALAPLVAEVHQTLEAGTAMSSSLGETLTVFDALMARFGVGEPREDKPKDPNAQPFRVQDYGETADQLAAAARDLTALLRTLDETLGSQNLSQLTAQVAPAVEQAQASGKDVVDYAFVRGLLLVAAVLAAALVYRILAPRLGASKAG